MGLDKKPVFFYWRSVKPPLAMFRISQTPGQFFRVAPGLHPCPVSVRTVSANNFLGRDNYLPMSLPLGVVVGVVKSLPVV
jgi:hypothetical protein